MARTQPARAQLVRLRGGCRIRRRGGARRAHPGGRQRPRLTPQLDRAAFRASDGAMIEDILETLPEPALVVAAGRVRTSNGAARAILGTEIDGEDVRLAIRHPAAVERLLTANPQGPEEAELVGLGEAERRWTMNVTPLPDGALFVRLTDRSEAHAAEQMRVDFVANASHELRTPLATLVGYAETLREQSGELDEETRERFTAIVHDEARRMQRLVEDLISLSRIEAERFSAPRDALDFGQLLREAVAGCRGLAAERGSEIRLDIEPDLPAVTGDLSQILQLADNLVTNALRYGRRGSPVRVALRRERDMLHLMVGDEGDGIAAEHI